MAAAGVASRRRSEELIAEGRVTVDGEVVRRQGVRVDPAQVVVRVDGVRLMTQPDLVYLALNKPPGVVSTMADEQGRVSLAELGTVRGARMFHVGRLDIATRGLLLLTNDGALAHRLMHPSFEVSREYLADVSGAVSAATLTTLRSGVLLEDGPAAVDGVRIMDRAAGRTLLRIRLHEGRTHLVRRLLAAVDHPVVDLTRVALGPLHLGTLREGKTRLLSGQEVSALYDLIEK